MQQNIAETNARMNNESQTVAQYGASLLGVVYTALGLIGFLPIDWINPYHPEGIGVRYLLNNVAINTPHNLFHLAIGLSGLYAARSTGDARLWGKIVGGVLLLLFAVGMAQAFAEGFPVDQLFLVFPLNSPAHILHLCTGALALYVGLRKQ